VPLILTIHDAEYGHMQSAADALGRLDGVKAAPVLFHMESFS